MTNDNNFKSKVIIIFVSLLIVIVLQVAYQVFALNPPSTQPPTGGGIISVDSNAPNNSLRIDSSGNVGIGTTTPHTRLDIVGALKLGSESTCNSDTEGAIRYNSTLKQFEGCNGSAWKLVASLSCDSVPDSFSFTPVSNATINTLYTSNTVTLSGFDCSSITASVTGDGNPQINCNNSGTWGTSCSVNNSSKQIQTRLTSSSSYNTLSTANVTINGVTGSYNVTTQSPPFACGDPVTFTYNGSQVTYGTVYSQGKCWLDRNLGASRVATAYNDSQAYGDLFQWGRLADGHQLRTSATTTTLSSTDNPGHNKFIVNDSPPYDWRSPQNDNLWQGVSGINNPCPSGWRIPTATEWDTERASWSQQNYNGAFASPLKLTTGGVRYSNDGSIGSVGSIGCDWSSTVNSTKTYCMSYNSTSASNNLNTRLSGFSVRCIKD